jgi:predicted adenylyl cyclase CyaB
LATEIELKIRVDSHAPVRERLKALNAEYVGTVIERNVMLDRIDGSLRASGCGLRVRATTVLDGKDPGSKVTFKGPSQSSTLKCREEVEARVENGDDAIALLERLGFRRSLEYHKKRERWRMDDCVVELDEPARLGLFVEIEGPGEASIRAVQKRLGLGAFPHIPSSYVDLTAILRRAWDRQPCINNAGELITRIRTHRTRMGVRP